MQLTKTTMIMAAAMLGTAGVAAAQGLSEPQARATLLAACTNVSALSRDHGGNWHAYCSKGPMMVDATGKVTADKGDTSGSMSEGQARATLMASCNNVSTLHVDRQGTWHGVCSKGPMMIDSQGKVVADKGGESGISRSAARAIASNACNNVSELSTDGSDNWTGACSKGSFAIDPSGKLAFK